MLVYLFSNMRMLEKNMKFYQAEEVDVEELCPQQPDPPATATALLGGTDQDSPLGVEGGGQDSEPEILNDDWLERALAVP